MDNATLGLVAHNVLDAVGGRSNVERNAVCMTRLRLSLFDMGQVNFERLLRLPGVLGVAPYGECGIEVVFGPAIIEGVFQRFVGLTGLNHDERSFRKAPEAEGGRPSEPGAVDAFLHPSAADPRDEQDSELPGGIDPDEAQWLRDIVGMGGAAASAAPEAPEGTSVLSRAGTGDYDNRLRRLLAQSKDRAAREQFSERSAEGVGVMGPRLLVINGPNLNMLGIREPGIYGNDSYATLVDLCERVGLEEGFAYVECFQSNHEGDLVDMIQEAFGQVAGIVINPGAYTHTSVALLDALKAVGIPAVEVHISQVSEREEFRQVSYVRAACFETITGEGVQGYVHAIRDLAARVLHEKPAEA